ncbi:MAG: molybdenum cofactor biosynthesis protein MoaE [Nitrososphaerota archaeon]|nr:molybdenum cofactor biosynthesis protein MoaE [Aigarchaeota archaeon]MDW8076670.1 molybdenum cofactor biosynthesis protein MoaE [Nitrososphaerota archaeon]
MSCEKKSLPSPGVYEKEELDLWKLIPKVQDVLSSGGSGAVASFLGIVKSVGSNGKKVEYLEIEAYDRHANPTIQAICEETKKKFDLEFVGIWHLKGKFKVGEPLVLVVVAGKSRKEVFQALEEAVNRYKTEPALFKKEAYENGTYKWFDTQH